MKTLRHLCTTTILSLTFAVSVLAGDIHCPGVVAPPPPPSETTTTGGITITVIQTIVSVTY